MTLSLFRQHGITYLRSRPAWSVINSYNNKNIPLILEHYVR